jgi:hypothetical protein
MPKPVEKKPKKTVVFLGLPAWSWVVIAVMFTTLIVAQCLGPRLISGR